ncbi:hypothetical protein FRC00_002371 [Tulasnella sp. 408]|nr:hypothetical protein FRC00_002371 [Tulasnella sp. 408]
MFGAHLKLLRTLAYCFYYIKEAKQGDSTPGTKGRTARGPLPVSLEAKVDLHDQTAVQSAKEKPLITVKKSDVKK